jgi:ABC-type transport system involved in Fe-S cluster assembly fused permease/ATPase subunit
LTHVFGRRVRRRSDELKRVESTALAVVQEVLGALRVVKALGQEGREADRFVSHSDQGLRARLRVLLIAGGLGLLVGLATALGTAAVLYIGVGHVQAGTLTLGELLLVMAYLAQLYSPLETISKKMADLQGSLASADRAFALLDEGPDVVERPGARPLARAAGAVAYCAVSFGYGERPAVLHGVEFEVPAGARVGITGMTGAGKTTLVNLVTRFFDPTGGVGARCVLSYDVTVAGCDSHALDVEEGRRDTVASAPYGDPSGRQPLLTRSVVIGDDVLVGIGAIVLKGVRSGDGATVGPGAVVTRDLPAGALGAGNPAVITERAGGG